MRFMASSNALKQWQGQWQSTSVLQQTQPLQVLLELDTFLKPKVVADSAPTTLGINSREIMWDVSYGRANLSSATRHKSAPTQAEILPHNEDCPGCTAVLGLLNHFLQVSQWGRTGHTLEICWPPEVIWEFVTPLHHEEMNLPGPKNTTTTPTGYFSTAAVTQSSSNPHLSVHLGQGKSLTHLDVDLLWHAIKARSNSVPG